jgi:hypothetical protein
MICQVSGLVGDICILDSPVLVCTSPDKAYHCPTPPTAFHAIIQTAIYSHTKARHIHKVCQGLVELHAENLIDKLFCPTHARSRQTVTMKMPCTPVLAHALVTFQVSLGRVFLGRNVERVANKLCLVW